eukprot:3484599-Lingulodinium_polyedra.AAC.1
MAHLADGVGRYARTRILAEGKLAADAAGALRAVVAGGVICETTARRWNGGRTLCPYCAQADEDPERRFWQRP